MKATVQRESVVGSSDSFSRPQARMQPADTFLDLPCICIPSLLLKPTLSLSLYPPPLPSQLGVPPCILLAGLLHYQNVNFFIKFLK
jgi:hypothetical protein